MLRVSCLVILYSSVTSIRSTSQTCKRNIPRSASFQQRPIRVDSMSSTVISSLRGGSSDDDAELDAYVERLLAGINDKGQCETNPIAGSDKEEVIDYSINADADITTDSLKTKAKKRRCKRKKSTKGAVNYIDIADTDIEMEEEDADVINHDGGRNGEDDDHKSNDYESENPSQPACERVIAAEHIIEESESKSQDTSDKDCPIRSPMVRRIPPPNTLQRFLLSQGYIGRTLAAFSILISEMIHRYLPELHLMIVSISPEPPIRGPPERNRQAQQGVHSQYAAFASGSSVGGKKMSKDQKIELDQVALNKLKHVKGGVKSGKYAHLSSAFMKRYNLGIYAEEAKMFAHIIAPIQSDDSQNADSDDVSEDDTENENEDKEDWVVQALSGKGNKVDREKDQNFLNVEPSVSIGTKGASVGLDLNINFSKDKKKPQSVIDAARGSKKFSKARKEVKVKGSDKDGGGGVLGRLRAASANSGVSSRLLGAYPGDAVPIEEASSKYGVIELAERYGYGDWSDDNDEGEEEYIEGETDDSPKRRPRSRKRKRSNSTTSTTAEKPTNKGRRRRRSSQSSPDLSMSFEFGTSASSRTRTSRSNDLHDAFRRNCRDNRVRQPTERPLERERKEIRVSQRELKSTLLGGRNSSSAVQAPMRRTLDLKKKQEESNSD